IDTKVITRLKEIFGEDRVLTSNTDMITYSYDASFETQLNPRKPQVAVIAKSTEEVSQCVKLANEYKIPVYSRCAELGQTEVAISTAVGVMFEVFKMNRILEIVNQNMQAIIETGVVQNDLITALKSFGLQFPSEPFSANMCTIGGMVSNN